MISTSHCCVIMGGYINGYAIIQELCAYKVPNLILVDYEKDPAYYSNKIVGRYLIQPTEEELLKVLTLIHAQYDSIILYPTHDVHLSHIAAIYGQIKAYCRVAFNVANIVRYQDKFIQYQFCEKLGVPYPKTILLKEKNDIEQIAALQFPILVKATSRHAKHCFRNAYLANCDTLHKKQAFLVSLLEQGVELLVSEVIPGDGSQIFAYVGYRNSQGEIIGEWTGRKLAQFPNDFGVFSSATSVKNNIVLSQGRKLIEAMDLWGVSEPEFKYDSRDGKYKLMEINLRPMMWHRVGALNNMPLNYIQYLDMQRETIPQFECEYNEKIYANFWYELLNLLKRRGYYKTFKRNVCSPHTSFALYDKTDKKPFYMAIRTIIRKVIKS